MHRKAEYSDEPQVAVIGAGKDALALAREFNRSGVLRILCAGPDALPIPTEFESPVEIYPLAAAQEILGRRDVTVVVVAVAAKELSADLTNKALENNKDVFVQSPFALSYRDCAQASLLAEGRQRLLMLINPAVHHPGLQKLIDLTAEGRSNRPSFVHIESSIGETQMDIAIALSLFQDHPLEVACSGAFLGLGAGPSVTTTTFTFPAGERAFVISSSLTPIGERRVIAYDRANKSAVIREANGKATLLMFDDQIQIDPTAPMIEEKAGVMVGLATADMLMRRVCQQFLTSLKTRKVPRWANDQTLKLLKVLEACEASLQSNGRPVKL